MSYKGNKAGHSDLFTVCDTALSNDVLPHWRFYTPVMAFQARQVEEQRSDKVAAQPLLSLYFPIFLPFTFLLFCSFISPISVLFFSSIYNIFALFGRKTPFTHLRFLPSKHK